MKAITVQRGKFESVEMELPQPMPGHVVVKTLTCGICGTDLHAQHHVDTFLKGLEQAGAQLPTDPGGKIVFGHEFCGEVIEHGGGEAGRFKPGTRVVGLPYVTGLRGAEYVGYSDVYPGGFADHMILTERLLFEVPNGLPSEHAALTEPFAVGAHAVARATITGAAITIVVGCGPIGLAVIAALKARGIGPVIATDFSEARRALAESMGADETVDPAAEPAEAIWARYGAGKRIPAYVFECVGRPGMVQSIIEAAPSRTTIIGVGNSLEPSHIDQVLAFNKELDIRFSMTYSSAEFSRTLDDIAEGRINTAGIVTGVVSPEQVPQAFDDLRSGDRHAKIVIKF